MPGIDSRTWRGGDRSAARTRRNPPGVAGGAARLVTTSRTLRAATADVVEVRAHDPVLAKITLGKRVAGADPGDSAGTERLAMMADAAAEADLRDRLVTAAIALRAAAAFDAVRRTGTRHRKRNSRGTGAHADRWDDTRLRSDQSGTGHGAGQGQQENRGWKPGSGHVISPPRDREAWISQERSHQKKEIGLFGGMIGAGSRRSPVVAGGRR